MKKSIGHFGKLPITAWIGLLTFALSTGGLIAHVEPFYTWFYCFSWWSYILVIDGMNRAMEEESLLIDHTQDFFYVAFCSVGVWLIFELFNLALKNWHYINVPRNLPIRWLGYFVAYATVLPGIFETATFLKNIGLFQKLEKGKKWQPGRRWKLWFVVLGFACLVLPVVLPQYFFPLVWLGFVFLLEPLNISEGQPSLVREAMRGSWRELGLLLVAGAICGFLWELWNYWAGGKWIYTVPWVGNIKLFEMPVLGFLGFPPFAVECYVMMTSLFLFRDKLVGGSGSESTGRHYHRRLVGIVSILVAMCLYCGVFSLIDKYTVISFR